MTSERSRARPPAAAAGLLAVIATLACGTATHAPASVAALPAVPATAAPGMTMNADSARHGYTAADVRFMQHMIAHHAQALAMTKLVPARTSRQDMRLLAERIDASQRTEIAMMERWLGRHGEEGPSADAPHAHHGAAAAPMLMPGMLTPEEMARLMSASGAQFEQLFLQFMIRHHEGALTMVAELFATPGAGQESEVFRFASDVDTDQRAEIRRMRALTDTSGKSQ